MAFTKQEYYETGINNSTGGYGANVYGGQTFEPTVAHTVTRVGVYAFRDGSPSGDGYIDLYLCNQATHLPTGARLARATYATADVTTAVMWLERNLDVGIALSQDTEYALIFSQPSSDASNNVKMKSDTPTPTYTRGLMLFSNTGIENLVTYDDFDYQFREYSGFAFIPKTMIF